MDINVDELLNEIVQMIANTGTHLSRHIYVRCLNDADVWHTIDPVTTEGTDEVCDACYVHWVEGKV